MTTVDAALHFLTGHGTENDFVLLDDPEGALELDTARVAALCDRRSGIGGDGLIRAVRTSAAGIDAPPDAPEWFMDYRNADGSLAEMCGNGVRVFAALLQHAGHVDDDVFAIWTRAGRRDVEVLTRPDTPASPWMVRVGMGTPTTGTQRRRITVGELVLESTDVDMGNPHAVAFLPAGEPLEQLDLTRRPAVDPDPADGTNIELVCLRGERHVALRVYERGVGETRSCGTGVAAVAVAAAQRTGDTSGRPWTVDVPGGRLEVGFLPDGTVTLTGPAMLVAAGRLLG